MNNLSLTSLLLTTLLVTSFHTRCMDLEAQNLKEPLVNNQQLPPDTDTAKRVRDCCTGTMCFTLSSTACAAVAVPVVFPVCAVLKTSVWFALLATLASGVTGTLIFKCCCTEPDNA